MAPNWVVDDFLKPKHSTLIKKVTSKSNTPAMFQLPLIFFTWGTFKVLKNDNIGVTKWALIYIYDLKEHICNK